MDWRKFLLNFTTQKRYQQFIQDCQAVAAASERRLQAILRCSRDSSFAQQHKLTPELTVKQFQRAIPIRSPQEFIPYTDRIAAGENNVLTCDPVLFLALTSGTTGTPKRCPVTRPFIREMHNQHLLWMRQLVNDRPAMAQGKHLVLVSKGISGFTAGGIAYGSMSGWSLLMQSIYIRKTQAVPYAIALITDPEARLFCWLLWALVSKNISTVTAVNPSTLVLISRKLLEYQEKLLTALESGQLPADLSLTSEEWQIWQPRWKKLTAKLTKSRLTELSKQPLLPALVWPEIKSIHTWHGGSADFFLQQLESWGQAPRRCLGLRASEGNFSIPLTDASPAGVLAISGAFMEFIPISTASATQDTVDPLAQTLLSHELEAGRQYRLIISSSSGFLRYDLGDIIEVTGKFYQAPLVTFLHRAGNVLSVTGEKVTERQITLALAASQPVCLQIIGASVSVELTDLPALVIIVESSLTKDELTSAAGQQSGRQFVNNFDCELAKLNIEYSDKRNSRRLDKPRLIYLASGSYERWRRRRLAQGAPEGQLKPPHLLKPTGVGHLPWHNSKCPLLGAAEIIAVITTDHQTLPELSQ